MGQLSGSGSSGSIVQGLSRLQPRYKPHCALSESMNGKEVTPKLMQVVGKTYFLVVTELGALAFCKLLADSYPQLIVASVAPSGLLHSLSLHQAHRKVSSSNLLSQSLIEHNLTMGVRPYHLRHILLDRSKL